MVPQEKEFWLFALFVCILILSLAYALVRIQDNKKKYKKELDEVTLLFEKERKLVAEKEDQLREATRLLEKAEEIIAEKEAQLEKITLLLGREKELVVEKEAQLQLRTSQAFLSPVSGIPNQLGSQARIDDMFDRLERGIVGKVTVAYIDLYKFKPINDEYGHHNGDKVIKIAGKILQHSIRRSDILIHLSGDEFCIICADTEKEEIEAILIRANNALAEYNFTFAQDGKVNTKYSYAFAESDKYHNTFEKLRNVADLDCTKVKKSNGESR